MSAAVGGPNVLVAEALQVELGSEEPWPKDAQLFQPFEVEQVLLYDNANCLAVQALFHMANLDFSNVMRANAEHMSPSGKLPFLRANKFVVAEFEPIVGFINARGISLTEHLDSSQKVEMRAYMSLVSVLENAELFICWNDEVTYAEVTQPRYGSVYSWPLNYVLTWRKRSSVRRKLAATGWGKKPLEEIYGEVEKCCQALSVILENHMYFYNNKPTELDALVFGHLFVILTTPLPDGRLTAIVRQYKNLVNLCQRIEKEFFGESMTSSGSSENFEKIP